MCCGVKVDLALLQGGVRCRKGILVVMVIFLKVLSIKKGSPSDWPVSCFMVKPDNPSGLTRPLRLHHIW